MEAATGLSLCVLLTNFTAAVGYSRAMSTLMWINLEPPIQAQYTVNPFANVTLTVFFILVTGPDARPRRGKTSPLQSSKRQTLSHHNNFHALVHFTNSLALNGQNK